MYIPNLLFLYDIFLGTGVALFIGCGLQGRKETQIASERARAQIRFVRAMKEEGSMTIRSLEMVIVIAASRQKTTPSKRVGTIKPKVDIIAVPRSRFSSVSGFRILFVAENDRNY